MLNFEFLEKGLGIVFPLHFGHDFSREKVYCIISINGPNLIVWFPLTLFRMGFFGTAHGWPPIPKIRHTYPSMIKLGTVTPHPNTIQKTNESRDTPLSSADISIFSPEISKFCYIKKWRYGLYFDI